jgi:DNA-binding MarR family transcriptional regulator
MLARATPSTLNTLLSGRPLLPPISPKQAELLAWLIEYSEQNGYFPVIRETATHFELTLSRVQALMAQLEKRGYIAKTAERSRNVQLTELTKSWYERELERNPEATAPLLMSGN